VFQNNHDILRYEDILENFTGRFMVTGKND